MLRTILIAGLLAGAGHAAIAQDYAANSEAKSWGLLGEESARFVATVTDAVCALTGDCPAGCGDGLRQMVVIRADDGVMFLVNKNIQAAFSGATVDLAPYCHQLVEVDGLMIGDPDVTPGLKAKLYQVQLIRPVSESEMSKANRFTKDWSSKNPDVGGKGPWFRRDPRILAEIEANGYLGLGAEADAAFIEENF
ncbi:MAG: hypothetical protein AAGC57_12190 [Pseudomonadota bacterium]